MSILRTLGYVKRKQPKKITVTQEHIDKGISDCEKCPIALAMKDAGVNRPFVGVMSIRDYNNNFFHYPKKVQWFRHRFDRHLSVKPISFILRRDDNVQQLIKI